MRKCTTSCKKATVPYFFLSLMFVHLSSICPSYIFICVYRVYCLRAQIRIGTLNSWSLSSSSSIRHSFRGMATILREKARSALHRIDQLVARKYLLVSALLLAFHTTLSFFVIWKVNYTEIDWRAYMDEVAGVLNNRQFDYMQLKGATGPLVYPAGFVYIYSVLYYLTDGGSNLALAKSLFAVLQSILLAFVLGIYRQCYLQRTNQTSFPIYIIAFLFISRRVMSLFVLRLFNDGIQMLLMYASVFLFNANRWSAGSFVYSLSLSVKMNALLFAPAVALLMCQACGVAGAFRRILGICLTTQLVLGAPFLLHAPKSYFSRAFELTRVFFHKWSVNGAFLPKETFLDKKLALLLLFLHLTVLVIFGHWKWTAKSSGGLLGLLSLRKPGSWSSLKTTFSDERSMKLNANHITNVLFTCNFVGIVFARTLHYQFYLWYAHSLPLMVWCVNLHWITKLGVLLTIEAVFNIYPPHPLAACALHLAHGTLLYSLWSQPRAIHNTIYTQRSRPVPPKSD